MIVDAPLRGEWVALNTPAERVPSHGTDYLGQTYAFDFIQTNPTTNLPYRRGFLRHMFTALPSESFLCWNQPVHSVFDGQVFAVGEGWPDHARVNLIGSLVSMALAHPQVDGEDVRPLAGNYVIVEGENAVAFYAHLRRESVTVTANQQVRRGDVLGLVGNSGNSTMPHLHFHLMDRPNILEAVGIRCSFQSYLRLNKGCWEHVGHGIPGRLERVRFGISD